MIPYFCPGLKNESLKTKGTFLYEIITKVLITCRFNDKILGHHFLVHEGFVIMMFYVLQEPKSGNPKSYH